MAKLTDKQRLWLSDLAAYLKYEVSGDADRTPEEPQHSFRTILTVLKVDVEELLACEPDPRALITAGVSYRMDCSTCGSPQAELDHRLLKTDEPMGPL